METQTTAAPSETVSLDAVQRAAEADRQRMQDQHEGQRIQLIEFKLGEAYYALPIDDIQEVVLTPSIAKVPQAAAYVLGVANIRGTIITIVDLEKRMGVTQSKTEAVHHGRYTLVLELEGMKVGILVEQVPNTLNTVQDAIKAVDEHMSASIAGAEGSYLKGILNLEARMVFLLDIRSLIQA